MNKKITAIFLAILMALPLMLVSCKTEDVKETSSATSSTPAATSVAQSDVSTEESEDQIVVPESIKTAGKIVMATNANFPPYEYIDNNGDIIGIDAEIMKAVADLWGVELKIENMEFTAILASIDSGKADVGVAGMTITEDRLKNVDFSYTYAKAKQVIIVKEDSTIAAAADLSGKKVGVQLGTVGDIYASDDDTIAAVEKYNNGVDAVLALTQGKVDAVIIDNEPAKVFVEKNAGLKIIEEAYADEDYAIAIKKGNNELCDAINKALVTLDENGTLEAIIEKYIPTKETVSK